MQNTPCSVPGCICDARWAYCPPVADDAYAYLCATHWAETRQHAPMIAIYYQPILFAEVRLQVPGKRGQVVELQPESGSP